MISSAIEKMIQFYNGNLHDINHFLKVWSFAHTIGCIENLDNKTQTILEISAIVHDIACPLCREKYGNTNGKYQEKEGILLAQEFLNDFNIAQNMKDRIIFLVGHHHTYTDISGLDYQILLEADFLVNADEEKLSKENIKSIKEKVFKTQTGIRLIETIYGAKS